MTTRFGEFIRPDLDRDALVDMVEIVQQVGSEKENVRSRLAVSLGPICTEIAVADENREFGIDHWRKAAEQCRQDIECLYRARDIVSAPTAFTKNLPAVLEAIDEAIAGAEAMKTWYASQPSGRDRAGVRHAVDLLIDLFADTTGQQRTGLRAGNKATPNSLCLFVQAGLLCCGVQNAGDSIVWIYVRECLANGARNSGKT